MKRLAILFGILSFATLLMFTEKEIKKNKKLRYWQD